MNPGFSALINVTVRISLLRLCTPLFLKGIEQMSCPNSLWLSISKFALRSGAYKCILFRERCVGEQDEACFWEECEESTNVWGEKSKNRKTTRLSHFSASCVGISLLFYSDDDNPLSTWSLLNLNSGGKKDK